MLSSDDTPFVVVARGAFSWGKGASIAEALKQCRVEWPTVYCGAFSQSKCYITVVMCEDQAVIDSVRVNDFGAITCNRSEDESLTVHFLDIQAPTYKKKQKKK
jgi:hypothetical protein